MGIPDNPNRSVKTVHTTFGIIELIKEHHGATLSEIAQGVNIAKSTAHDHVMTLRNLGYLINQGNEYQLSFKFFDHGMSIKQNHPASAKVLPVLEELANDTGECVWFLIEEDGMSIFLEGIIGDRGITAKERIGLRRPLHCHAAGKAILASMSDEDVRAIINHHGLPEYTDETITDENVLFETLATIRKQGYAISRGEVTQGLNGIASGIHVEGVVRGSVAISAPSERLQDNVITQQFPEEVLGAANAIELKLTH